MDEQHLGGERAVEGASGNGVRRARQVPGRRPVAVRTAREPSTTHALEIDGPGVSDKASDTVSPGSSTSLTVTLRKGSYELYCPVDGHKDLGMDTTITVG